MRLAGGFTPPTPPVEYLCQGERGGEILVELSDKAPPGRRTPNTSAFRACLSGMRLMLSLEPTMSKAAGGKGSGPGADVSHGLAGEIMGSDDAGHFIRSAGGACMVCPKLGFR